MRTFWKCTLILAVQVLLMAAAPADEPLVPEGTTVHLILLRQKSVQEELKLSPDVVKKIMEFTKKEHEAFQKALTLGEKEREEKIEELEKTNQKFLADNLTDAQRKRLGQIHMHVTGLRQLSKPEIIKALELTADQQEKIKEMQKEAAKTFEGILDPANRESRHEKIAKLRAEIDKKIEALLTDKQKEKAKELVGEPFKGALIIEEPDAAPKDKE
jgi:Spy/CpxP family protein refolding chaperone